MNYRYLLSFLLCIPLADIFGGVKNTTQLNPKKYSFKFIKSSKNILNDDENCNEDDENGFDTENLKLVNAISTSHQFGSFIIKGQITSLLVMEEQVKYWSDLHSELILGLNKTLVSPFIQVTHRLLNVDGKYTWNDITTYAGMDMDVANLKTDTYSIDTRLLVKAGCSLNEWRSEDIKLTGSIEWAASLNLNSGVSFNSSLNIDTDANSYVDLTVSLDR